MQIKLTAAKDMKPGDRTGHNFEKVVEEVSTPFHGRVLIKWLGEDVTIFPEGHRFPVEVPGYRPDYEAALREIVPLCSFIGSRQVTEEILRRHGVDPQDVQS